MPAVTPTGSTAGLGDEEEVGVNGVGVGETSTDGDGSASPLHAAASTTSAVAHITLRIAAA